MAKPSGVRFQSFETKVLTDTTLLNKSTLPKKPNKRKYALVTPSLTKPVLMWSHSIPLAIVTGEVNQGAVVCDLNEKA